MRHPNSLFPLLDNGHIIVTLSELLRRKNLRCKPIQSSVQSFGNTNHVVSLGHSPIQMPSHRSCCVHPTHPKKQKNPLDFPHDRRS
jgi:hypothetical protein